MAESSMDEYPLIWMGCVHRNILTELQKEITNLLTRLRVNFETLEKEECCGFPLILSGHKDKAKEFAESNVHKIGDKKRVVTTCPACYRAFNEFYPNLLGKKLPFRVSHITQYYCELIDNGVLKPSILKPLKMKVMYHDPCELGRHSKIFEEPRRVLKLIPGLALYEPRFTRELSTCCGGGGLVSAYFPTLSVMVASRKILEEDRVPNDVQAIVTECPQCVNNLQRAWNKDGTPLGIKVYNLAKILNMSLGDQSD
jgi:heterodisulfide reductase subunit D